MQVPSMSHTLAHVCSEAHGKQLSHSAVQTLQNACPLYSEGSLRSSSAGNCEDAGWSTRGDGDRQPMASVHHILSAEQLHDQAQVTPSSHLVSRSLLSDNESLRMDGSKASPPDPKFLK